MKIYNGLPILLDCLRRWEKCPSPAQFEQEFVKPMSENIGSFFDDFYDVLPELDWAAYRNETLLLDPEVQEQRVREILVRVEKLLDVELVGEIALIGAFEAMDGYARFDRGTHRVFLGVDESHRQGRYLDILIAHELTHVARESRPEIWEGWGLNPKMTQDEFRENQPVIEHLLGEGFSCAVSEILFPGENPWLYVYQTEKSLFQILDNAQVINHWVHLELGKAGEGDYGRLYHLKPTFAHYFWAWQWTKSLITNHADGDAKKLLTRCSKDFLEDALRFKIKGH